MKKLVTFCHLPWGTRWLLLAAFWRLGLTRAVSFWLPFRYLAPYLGAVQQADQSAVTPAQQAQIDQVAWAVRVSSRYTPWTSNCMAQAMAAKWLLQRRGIASTLYIGVHKVDQRLAAHAWLGVGEQIVTGGGDLGRYKQVACFGETYGAR